MKVLAMLRPKATGNEKVDKIFGQLRHALDSVFSILLGFGLLSKFGVEVTPESWSLFWSIASETLDAVFVVIGAAGKLIVHVSSWFSKETE